MFSVPEVNVLFCITVILDTFIVKYLYLTSWICFSMSYISGVFLGVQLSLGQTKHDLHPSLSHLRWFLGYRIWWAWFSSLVSKIILWLWTVNGKMCHPTLWTMFFFFHLSSHFICNKLGSFLNSIYKCCSPKKPYIKTDCLTQSKVFYQVMVHGRVKHCNVSFFYPFNSFGALL